MMLRDGPEQMEQAHLCRLGIPGQETPDPPGRLPGADGSADSLRAIGRPHSGPLIPSLERAAGPTNCRGCCGFTASGCTTTSATPAWRFAVRG